ncbi:4-alpha-glucanotransferase [Desulfurivibrio alkaliphilus]|uniref:4-alpha-glucanotransferase n=1 Tax=Desulfurivibrio alkaliphilus (strain DSM 19089 / UNIQEM U267 / AHT2) TaxID=589865 RepID=D6Z2I8_DESAT|nr:4-alpha-glucanotransferase [Desulfurivibrio alkaliphilus]ADH85763.1 4-alpha-glucanotransferase [Desulfurivibrio alkaliphilus AHT 2]
MTDFHRGSGVLLHITSLPGPYGIGELGPQAHAFVDFLAAAGQSYWQFLPLCPTSPGLDNSPYMGLSAFAGNNLLISLEGLREEGLLGDESLRSAPEFSEYLVDFAQVRAFKEQVLAEAFALFERQSQESELAGQLAEFKAGHPWLADYALFISIHEEQQGLPWYDWPEPLARREPAALAEQRRRLAARIDYHEFVQFIFYRQWQQLHAHAAARGISLIGDLPIYVALDSAEVWAWPECFLLDPKTHRPTHVAGVPPDYFSATGQRWGNPLFRWHGGGATVQKSLHRWWQRRFAHQFAQADIVRIDHFRGFEAFWQVPAEEPDAVRGQWVAGPGREFFRKMEISLGKLPIIAEDLGLITPEVEELRDRLGFPGMKVLQFAFDSDETNAYLPHNYAGPNCVVYTGTHDNDTSLGWYLSDQVSETAKERFLRYANSRDGRPVHRDFIRLALSSVGAVVIIPLQDVLGFGSDCRMNVPGTAEGNWRWRVASRFLTAEVAAELREETGFYNRLPPPLNDQEKSN